MKRKAGTVIANWPLTAMAINRCLETGRWQLWPWI